MIFILLFPIIRFNNNILKKLVWLSQKTDQKLFLPLVETSSLSQANQCFGPRSISVSLLKVPVITELLRFYWIICQREGPGALPLTCCWYLI